MQTCRECLIKHTYKEGTRQPNKDGMYDHLGDALGYVVYQNFVIRKEYNAHNKGKSMRYSGARR